MVHDINAIFDQGVFRPLDPVVLPDGARVHLRVEQQIGEADKRADGVRIHSPRLAHPGQAVEFQMDVREVPDAGI